jgi:hypothetical protein
VEKESRFAEASQNGPAGSRCPIGDREPWEDREELPVALLQMAGGDRYWFNEWSFSIQFADRRSR